MSKGYDDSWDRRWAKSFLIKAKGKLDIQDGPKMGIDLKDYNSNYGVDVEEAQNYNPLTRGGDITIPYRKDKITKYWQEERETDYVQFCTKSFDKLIYIKDSVIRKYKNNPRKRTNFEFKRHKPWVGYTWEECKEIWNTYIEIPKSDIEVWIRTGSKGNWNWVQEK